MLQAGRVSLTSFLSALFVQAKVLVRTDRSDFVAKLLLCVIVALVATGIGAGVGAGVRIARTSFGSGFALISRSMGGIITGYFWM